MRIGLAVRVFANGPGNQGSIPGRVIPKTQKIVLDASLLNTQHYKVQIKGKVEQSRERSSAVPYTSMQQLWKREPLGHPRLRSPTLLTYIYGQECIVVSIYKYISMYKYAYRCVCTWMSVYKSINGYKNELVGSANFKRSIIEIEEFLGGN